MDNLTEEIELLAEELAQSDMEYYEDAEEGSSWSQISGFEKEGYLRAARKVAARVEKMAKLTYYRELDAANRAGYDKGWADASSYGTNQPMLPLQAR